MDYISTNDPYVKNFSLAIPTDMHAGDIRHIEIDDRVNLMVICQSDGLYSGLYYWIQGKTPIVSFENRTIPGIVEVGYEDGILSTMSAGSIYNEAATSMLADAVPEVGYAEPVVLESTTKQLHYGTNREVTITENSYGDVNISILRPYESASSYESEKSMEDNNDLFKSFKLTTTLDDFESGDFKKSTDEKVQEYLTKKADKLEKSRKIETKAEDKYKTSKVADLSKSSIIQAAHVESRFEDKEDTLFSKK